MIKIKKLLIIDNNEYNFGPTLFHGIILINDPRSYEHFYYKLAIDKYVLIQNWRILYNALEPFL